MVQAILYTRVIAQITFIHFQLKIKAMYHRAAQTSNELSAKYLLACSQNIRLRLDMNKSLYHFLHEPYDNGRHYHRLQKKYRRLAKQALKQQLNYR